MHKHFKHKDWIRTLAFDVETTISLLPDKDQSYMRQLVAKNIKKIQSKYSNMEGKRFNNAHKTRML
jgi:ferric iron reductase protein FhuF